MTTDEIAAGTENILIL